jgi:pimeloyl-ACP methyl ester carboxylesterase
MTTFALIHGAGSDGWYWHLVEPELRALGHNVVAPDLPCDDDRAGLHEYKRTVVEAIGDYAGDDVVVVGQSLGGLTAPLVADQVDAIQLVLVAPMVPSPGETAGAWWSNTGWDQIHAPIDETFDPEAEFFHDVPPAVKADAWSHGVREQSGHIFGDPWPLAAWPDIETRVVVGRIDRFFPLAFQQRVVRERLGIVPDEIDSGHLPAFSRPRELAQYLDASRR